MHPAHASLHKVCGQSGTTTRSILAMAQEFASVSCYLSIGVYCARNCSRRNNVIGVTAFLSSRNSRHANLPNISLTMKFSRPVALLN
jgi:hypothetical protein